jgi:hypothetical protein
MPDEDNKNPNTAPNLTNLESSSNESSGESSNGSLNNAELNNAENNGKTDQVGRGYSNKKDKPSKTKLVIKGIGKYKKGIATGGGGGGIMVALIFAILAFVPFELVHIEKNILNYESKIEQRFENKAASDIMQKVMNRANKKAAASRAEDSQTEAKNGETLASEMDSFDITSPQIIDDLGKVGITVSINPTTGAFEGIKDSAGNDITGEVATNDTLFNNIEAQLPEWQAGQLESFRSLMVDHAGASFRALPDTAGDNVEKTIVDNVTNGADPLEIATASTEEQGKPAPNDTSTATAQSYANATNEAGQLGTAEAAAEAAANAGESGTAAVEAGVSSFGSSLGNPLLLSTVASTGCGLIKDVTIASKDRVPTIMKLLMRHGTLLISLADQLKTGHITSSEVNQTMKLLNGTPGLLNSDGTKSEASLPFSSSAAWQNITGNTGGITIDKTSLPTKNTGTKIVNDINSALNESHANLVCSVENSPFGFVANGFAGVVQVAADGFSLGSAQVVIIAGNVAAMATIHYVVLPEIIKYFTPFGINGSEDAVQFLNNSDAGLNLSFNDYARRLGANPVTSSTASNLVAEANKSQIQTEAQQSWVNRTFALSNPLSLVSRVVSGLPIGISSMSTSIMNYFTSIPVSLFHNFSAVFLPKSYAAVPTTAPGEAYGITQYAFTDNEVNKYDPISNEQYLFGSVSAGGNSVRRIDALGNPGTYTDSPAGDSNNNDLMHCYVDSFADIEKADPNTGADQYCGSVGTYDSDSNSPTNLPSDSTIIQIYCNNLGNPANCIQEIAPQVNDDIGHFRQYLLDLHVMETYTSLTNKQ